MKKVFTILFVCLFISTPLISQWSQSTNYAGAATDGAPCFVIGNYSYVGGGIGSKKFYKFDPANESWTQLSDIPSGFNRGWAFSFVISGKGYICGGDKTGNFAVYKDVREYNPATDTWTKKADLPIAMDGAFSCSVNGKGYVIGGFNGSVALSSVYEYDPVANIWTSKASYPGGQAIFPAGFVINNKIYVGIGSMSGMAGTNLFYEYNPATNIWAQKANFPGGVRQASIGFAIGNIGYIGGGEQNYSTMYYDFYKYSPLTNSWVKDNSLNMQNGTAAAWCSSFVIGTTVYYGLGASFAGGSLNYSNKFYKASISVGMAEMKKEYKIKVYPNPAIEKINIEIPYGYKPTSIIILNSLGQKCLVNSNDKRIDISSLTSGLYFVEIHNKTKLLRSKFIIK